MIQVVTGKLGAGKTLFSVMHIFEMLCKGRTVCTNIAVDWEQMELLAAFTARTILDSDQLVRVDPEKNPDWHKVIPWGTSHKHPVEVVLDEIHLFFNSRDWQKTDKERRSLLKFLTQSRKSFVNITFIAQEITTVEKQFRALAEWEMYVMSSDHLPLGWLGKSPVKFFIVLQRDANNGVIVKKHFKTYDKRYWKLYQSFSFLDEEMNALHSKVEKRDVFRLPKISFPRWFWLHFTNFFTFSK